MGADGVVDDAEMVNFHVKGVAVGDVSAEEVLVFEGAEEAFDGAVGLGGFDSGARTWRSRGSLLSKAVWKVCPRKAGPVVGDHRDGGRQVVDDGFGGIDNVHHAAVGAQILKGRQRIGPRP